MLRCIQVLISDDICQYPFMLESYVLHVCAHTHTHTHTHTYIYIYIHIHIYRQKQTWLGPSLISITLAAWCILMFFVCHWDMASLFFFWSKACISNGIHINQWVIIQPCMPGVNGGLTKLPLMIGLGESLYLTQNYGCNCVSIHWPQLISVGKNVAW